MEEQLTGTILETPKLLVEITESGEAVMAYADGADAGEITEALRELKALGYRWVKEMYFDEDWDREVTVYEK